MTIRDIPDDVIRRLGERATATGRLLEAEARAVLSASVSSAGDWDAFRHANALLKTRLGSRRAGNSVEELSQARAGQQTGLDGRP